MSTKQLNEKNIFKVACSIESKDAQEEYLNQVCGEDVPLLKRVVVLLRMHAEEPDFLESPAISVERTFITPQPTEAPGAMIGPYKIREQLGEGGMGVVYVADQTEPVRRRVALKVIKPGMDSKEIIGRFQAERQTLAIMSHPNIAKVLDGGTTENGRPYFVMELVKGIPITEFCDQQKLNIRERLELFTTVCQAVQHAHMKGIIHRDLKPSNVMVELHDVLAVPKVIDFGIAKATNQQLTQQTVYTQFSQLVGTPLYMSPEQAQVSGIDIDTRSDVYSLGVMLYELLTGVTPFDKSTLSSVGIDEMRRIIREDEPLRPSNKVSTLEHQEISTISASRQTIPKEMSLSMQRELDWIVMKALEKDRTRRYESANALAADIQRYLNDEPVEACPPTVKYRLTKYAKRHKGLLTTAAVMALTLLAATGVSVSYAVQADQERQQADTARDDADEQKNDAIDARLEAETQTEIATELAVRADNATQQAKLAQQREVIERQRAEKALYVSSTRLAAANVRSGGHSESFDLLLQQFPIEADADHRDWEWYFLLSQSNQSLLSWQGSASNIPDIAWSPDGQRIATASWAGFDAEIWNAETGESIRQFNESRMLAMGIDWNPDGQQLAWGSVSSDCHVRVWDEQSDEIVKLHANTASHRSVRWNPDGTQILLAAIVESNPEPWMDGTNLVIWKRVDRDWELHVKIATGKFLESAEWNFDGSKIAVEGSGKVWLVSPETLESLHEFPIKGVSDASWHRSNNRLAVTTDSGDCVILDVDAESEEKRFQAHQGKIRDVQWSPDGKKIATCGVDGFVKIWTTDDWSLVSVYSGHEGIVNAVSWHPDSEKVASCGYDGRINIWPVVPESPIFNFQTSPINSPLDLFAWTADGLIRTSDKTRGVVDRDPRTGEIQRHLELPDGKWVLRGRHLAFHHGPRDKSDQSADVIVFKNERSPSQTKIKPLYRIWTHSDATQFVYSTGRNSFLTLSNLSDEKQLQLGSEKLYHIGSVSWSPDGSTIAVVGGGLESDDGYPQYSSWLHLFNARTGQAITRWSVGENRLDAEAVTWSPDSTKVAAATHDGVCSVFDAKTHRQLLSRRIHRLKVISMSWHPDGKRIASACADQSVAIWDSESGDVLVRFPVEADVRHIEWSPDGKMLASKDAAGHFRVWDATTGFEFAESDEVSNRVTDRLITKWSSKIITENFSEASRVGTQLLNRDRTSSFRVYYYNGLMSAFEGDVQGYSEMCARMLEKFVDSDVPLETHFTAWTCTLAPDAIEDYAPAIKLARHAIEQESENQQYLDGLGSILMRAGEYVEAKEILEQALAAAGSTNTSTSYIRYFLAMTEQHLGNVEAAQTLLKEANMSSEKELAESPRWNRKMTLELLRKEAEALVETATENNNDDN